MSIDDLNEYMAVSEDKGIPVSELRGTTNDPALLGVGAFRVSEGNIAKATVTAIAPGAEQFVTLTTDFRPQQRQVPTVLTAVFVDVDGDYSYAWPNGANITTTTSTSNTPRPRITSNDLLYIPVGLPGIEQGHYLHHLLIENRDTTTHSYYCYFQVFTPFSGGTS